MANNNVVCDKCIKCCVTCMYWGGPRNYDGLGCYTYDFGATGSCNQALGRGFSGSKVGAHMECQDYEPQH